MGTTRTPTPTASSPSAPRGSRIEFRTEVQRLQDQLRLWREQLPPDTQPDPSPTFNDLGRELCALLEDAARRGVDTEALTGLAWESFDAMRRREAQNAEEAT